MDIYHVALVLGELIASGLLIYKAIDLAKISPAFPWLTPERVDLIRLINLALSAISVALIAFANHALGITEIQNVVQPVMEVIAVWSIAHAAHKNLKKGDSA